MRVIAFGDFGCCGTCLNRDTSDCDDCQDADLYEVDVDAVEEQMDALAA